MKLVVGFVKNTLLEHGSEYIRIGLNLTLLIFDFPGDFLDAEVGMPTRLWHTHLIVGPLDFARSIVECPAISVVLGHSTVVPWHASDVNATDLSGIECLPTVVVGGVMSGTYVTVADS